jgi:hypothetical protein
MLLYDLFTREPARSAGHGMTWPAVVATVQQFQGTYDYRCTNGNPHDHGTIVVDAKGVHVHGPIQHRAA